MANASYIQPGFLGGIWSPWMQGRIDLPKYRMSMNICFNGIPVEEGAWTRRPGSQWLGTTRSGAAGRVMGWDFQENLPMLLEFTNGHLRAFQGYQFGSILPRLGLLQTDARFVSTISTANPAVVTMSGNISWATGDQVMFGQISPAGALPLLQNRLFTITLISGTSPSSVSLADAITGAPINGSTLGWGAGVSVSIARIADIVTPWTDGSWLNNRLISLGQQVTGTSTQAAASKAIILNGATAPQALSATMFNASGGDLPVLTLAPAQFSDGPYNDVINGAQITSTVSGNAGVIAQFPGWNGGAGGTAVSKGQLVSTTNSTNTTYTNWVCIQNQPDSQAAFSHWGSAYYTEVTATAPFPTYNSGTGYVVANVVEYNSLFYICIQNATNQEPDTSPTYWTAISLASQASVSGSITLDLSFAAWSATSTFNTGDVCSYSGTNYQSLQDNNINNEPDTSPTFWTSGVNAGLPFGTNGAQSTDVGRVIRLFYQPPQWSASLTYSSEDVSNAVPNVVTYQGSYYQAIFTNTSQAANVNQIPPSSLSYWQPVAGSAYAGWTWGIVTAVNSATEVVVNIVGAPLLYPANVISIYQVGAFSATTGWPTCGIFYQGRLWLAGAAPNRVDSSMADQPFVFSPTGPDGTVSDNNAITVIFNSADNEFVQWLRGVQQGIVVGTLSHERLINASTQADNITPSTVQENPITKYGSAFVEPRECGLATVFVQRFQRQVMELVANVFSGRYNAPNLALPVKHLTQQGVAELAYQEEIVPVIWARTSAVANGYSLLGCTYRRVTAFSTDNPAMTNEPSTFAAWHNHTLGSNRGVYSITTTQTPGGVLDQLAMVTIP